MFTRKYVIICCSGAGVLSLPSAFAKAGVFASSIFIVLISKLASITMAWSAEVCARSEAWVSAEDKMQCQGKVPVAAVKADRKFEMAEVCEVF